MVATNFKFISMKYINNIAVYATLIFAVKKMFFDDYLDLGVVDEYYGIVFFILLLVLMSCRIFNKKKMKNKNWVYKFYYYSNIIVNRLFWGYFLLMVIYRFFISKDIPLLLSYLFFLLLGIYWGYKLARKAYDYLKIHQEDK